MVLTETTPLTDAVIAVAERSFFAWAEPGGEAGVVPADSVWHKASAPRRTRSSLAI